MPSTFPEKLIFADVETTGLHSTDRIVSLGLVELDTASIADGRLNTKVSHLVFDPGRKSHPRAEEVHGYDDWTLRHQESFEKHAAQLHPHFEKPELVWAHNARFDHAFISREFEMLGLQPPASMSCTMELYRSHFPGQRANLNAVTQSMGIRRSSETRHGALEDAWLAMLVFLNLHGFRVTSVPPVALAPPTNLVEPPRLEGPLPRRSSRKKLQQSTAASEPTIPRDTSNLIERCRPLATLMAYVAVSDGEVSEIEWDCILDLVEEIASIAGVSLSKAQRLDVVADLISPRGPAFSIRRAAEGVIRDPYSRENIARWVRRVTFADGNGSHAENRAILEITEALRTASANAAPQ